MTETPHLLAPHVRTLARGPGRSRSLTRDEAREVMEVILSGRADPEAVGAILMLLRMKGEVPDEIAGFAEAARETLPQIAPPALDWPSYAAGRTRGLPFFLLAARLVAGAGHPVLIHGWNSAAHMAEAASVRDALPHAGITAATSVPHAGELLERQGIAYLPLEAFQPGLLELLRLREKFNLRSCVNTVLRVLNPAKAPASVQGVFHPPYRELQADAGKLLGQSALSVIKGGGGEFERNPMKSIALYGLRNGEWHEGTAPAILEETGKLNQGWTDAALLSQLWSGDWADPFAEAIVIGTAALALDTLGVAAPETTARHLWEARAGLKVSD
ncbi:glycosyl transferase family protein [Pseudooceanicola sp. CBS1P-1]|uniref:Glycosyl transferase family protein n=1 Tax=Pseudooceanicola albus TaxID=2692189 RepID=A0A6L7G938_9RHOB|nr:MULTISPECIES: glycosyl transferase family protein [Pseudooceanicola]MBT9385816.1 glycosyl transferase family protein [Pseudooceanicola endophyticus]MXN20048.1 glycosyl transferase family protein [Pseudooceanicola albus]